jgi:hypothetical protein
VHPESVRPHIRHLRCDVDVHAVYHRHDDDQGGGGENDAEQGQETPQFARTERTRGDPQRLTGRASVRMPVLERKPVLRAARPP